MPPKAKQGNTKASSSTSTSVVKETKEVPSTKEKLSTKEAPKVKLIESLTLEEKIREYLEKKEMLGELTADLKVITSDFESHSNIPDIRKRVVALGNSIYDDMNDNDIQELEGLRMDDVKPTTVKKSEKKQRKILLIQEALEKLNEKNKKDIILTLANLK